MVRPRRETAAAQMSPVVGVIWFVVSSFLFWCVNRVSNVHSPFGSAHSAAKVNFAVEAIRLTPDYTSIRFEAINGTVTTVLPIIDHCSVVALNTTASPASLAQVDGSLALFGAQYTTKFMDYLP